MWITDFDLHLSTDSSTYQQTYAHVLILKLKVLPNCVFNTDKDFDAHQNRCACAYFKSYAHYFKKNDVYKVVRLCLWIYQ